MLFLAAFILKVRSKGNIINYMTHLLLNLRLVLFKMISNKKSVYDKIYYGHGINSKQAEKRENSISFFNLFSFVNA